MVIKRKSWREIQPSKIKKLVQRILKDSVSKAIPSQICEITVLFCDDKEIQTLNKKYRSKNKPTDVLSFSQIEGTTILPWEQSLGELVISVDTLKNQSKEFEVTFNEELTRLIVHGIHHLLGFDHEKVSATKAAQMRRSEKRILSLLQKERYC